MPDQRPAHDVLPLGAAPRPTTAPELLARLRAALRRAVPTTQRVIEISDLSLDLEKRELRVRGKPVSLTPIEYDLLRLLAVNEGKLLTHPAILRAIWGRPYREESNYLHVYVSHLRRKIEPDPTHPDAISTVRGVGYMFVPPTK